MFNLTQEEHRVILFLIVVALCGITINFLGKHNSCVRRAASFNQDIGKINLNTADKEMLMSVTGIGEKLSQRILDYRKAQGYFKDIEELKKVKGITDYRFNKIKDLVMVE